MLNGTSHPMTTSHCVLPQEVCESLGITKQLVRISVGIKHLDDNTLELKVQF
ncbi:PLP-dependent transferase [Paenisporosarcina sp. TG-14]|uniref:PLP-dependent transferase n=1 Tax=Paenisporosarcina sp. TG-14 TaxID=1231057 RepID=UPI003FCC6736